MSPDLQYVLDSAVELGEITPLEAEVLRADTSAHHAVDALLARDEGFPPDFLRNTARAYLAECDKPTRFVWALRGLTDASTAMRFLQERIEFAVERQAQLDLQSRRPDEGLFMVELAQGPRQPVFSTYDDVCEANVTAFVRSRYGRVLSYLQEDLDLAVQAMHWLTQPGARARATQIAQALFSEQAAMPSVNTAQRVKLAREARKSQGLARSAIKKATALLSRFGRAKDLQMLVSGQRVVLSHPDSKFKFELVPHGAGWLEERTRNPGGTAPFEVYLLTKEDVVLSRLCVYFKDTPVLDQLLALTLFVDTGNERELLSTANWFGFPDVSVTREVLTQHAPELLSKVPNSLLRPMGTSSMADQLREVLRSDWDAFRGPVHHWVSGALAGLRGQVQLMAAPDRGLLGLAVPA